MKIMEISLEIFNRFFVVLTDENDGRRIHFRLKRNQCDLTYTKLMVLFSHPKTGFDRLYFYPLSIIFHNTSSHRCTFSFNFLQLNIASQAPVDDRKYSYVGCCGEKLLISIPLTHTTYNIYLIIINWHFTDEHHIQTKQKPHPILFRMREKKKECCSLSFVCASIHFILHPV